MPVTAPGSHLDLLERPLICAWATVRPDGWPQVNPMWFLWDGEQGVFKLTHTRTRSNYQVLQSERKVALVVVDPDDRQRYLGVRGTVTGIQDDPEGDFFKVLSRRYNDGRAPEVVEDRAVRVILTITPDHFRPR